MVSFDPTIFHPYFRADDDHHLPCLKADDRPAGVSHERNQSNEAVAREEGGVAVAASATPAAGAVRIAGSAEAVRLVAYEDERQLSDIMSLVDRDLSEPYSIFTYRYFLHNWPGLCFVVRERPIPRDVRSTRLTRLASSHVQLPPTLVDCEG